MTYMYKKNKTVDEIYYAVMMLRAFSNAHRKSDKPKNWQLTSVKTKIFPDVLPIHPKIKAVTQILPHKFRVNNED